MDYSFFFFLEAYSFSNIQEILSILLKMDFFYPCFMWRRSSPFDNYDLDWLDISCLRGETYAQAFIIFKDFYDL